MVVSIFYKKDANDPGIECNGLTLPNNTIIVSGATGSTLAHEYGHQKGLGEMKEGTAGADPRYIMWYQAGDKNYIASGQVENFER